MGIFSWRKKREGEENLGGKGEKIAVKYLKKKGYKILDTNFKNPFGRRLGEIDIVACKNKELIFVEVKTRVLDNFSDILPEESITPSKLHKLAKIANFYVRNKRLMDIPYQFDAISVWIDEKSESAKIKHIENIFY